MTQLSLIPPPAEVKQSDFEFVPPGQTGERKGLTATATLPRTNFPDICKNRHRGNPQSIAANSRLHPRKQGHREQILSFAQESGSRGVTLSEACERFEKLPHQLSGRFSELVREGKLRLTGKTKINPRGNYEAVYEVKA